MKNSYHINILSSQLYGSLRRIQQTRAYLDEDSARIIVQTLILLKTDYCSSLLAGSEEYELYKLQRIQNMACRIILKLRKFDHVSDHLKALHWLKIHERIAYKISMLVFKCKCNLAPKYLQDLLPKRQHTRSLRISVYGYKDPCFCKNTLVKNSSFSSVGPRTWDS